MQICLDFPEEEWEDRVTYWQSRAEQRSPSWHRHRSGRLTASNFGTAAGYNKFTTPEQLADELAGLKKRERTPDEIATMDYGTLTEPVARSWYARTRRVQVEERGLCVPKWDPRIGASSDGEIDPEGLLEIKAPKRMYGPLEAYSQSSGDKCGVDHIWKSHYCQMIGNLAITGRSWCDYVVFCPNEDKVFVQRVSMDRDFWERDLYPKLRAFIRDLLDPRLARATLC